MFLSIDTETTSTFINPWWWWWGGNNIVVAIGQARKGLREFSKWTKKIKKMIIIKRENKNNKITSICKFLQNSNAVESTPLPKH